MVTAESSLRAHAGRDERFFDLYRYDAKTYQRTLFYRNEQGYEPTAISDDGRWVASAKLNTTNDSDIYLWDGSTKAVAKVSTHQGQANYTVATFDPTSTHLYYLTDEGSEFTRVRRYGLADQRHEDVQKANWDIVFTSFSHKGRYRITGINEDGRITINVIETATGRPVTLPAVPQGGVRGVEIARSESKMAFYVNADRAPSDLHVLQMSSGTLTKLTTSLWVRTLESIPAWWEAQRTSLYTEMGDPKADRQMLLDVSPLFHADKIKKPLLVLQGANDLRVIKAESDDIVAAAKKNGVPVEYVVFPDEGHGLTKKKNQIDGYGAILRFLDQHLKGKPAGTR